MSVSKIRRGDTVKLVKGRDSGKQGKVLRIIASRGKVVVDGVNVYKKHLKGDGKKKESAIVEILKPISIANIRIVCSSCGKPTIVKIAGDSKSRVRVCKICKKPIDIKKTVAPKKKKEVKVKETKVKKSKTK
jgi:large subunit ribosomal protein L24